nr:hypothetical protein CFP56_42001 [Quercus suber]
MTNATGVERCSQLVMTAWALWSNRNEIHYGGEGKTGPALALWATNYLLEYRSAVDTGIDVALDPVLHLPEVVLHLPETQQQSLQSAWLPPLAVEAKAYETSLLLARHLGLRDGVLEGDSLTISNALKRSALSPTSVAAVVEGIHVLGAEIGVINFSHVRRTGKKPAHILARQAQNLVNDIIWIEEIPCCIQQALI